tara:strand:- start:243 stop:1094 length:852 start_codon:yes stop_codon:yes gene_type:complete
MLMVKGTWQQNAPLIMISLKRNSKKQLVEATGIRTRKSSIYNPGQSEDFKISRSKFDDFLKCKKCFYLDRVKGFESPQIPQFKLNELTDKLFKKEFDLCREKGIPHRLFKNNNLEHLIPFKHKDIERWRDSLHYGLMAKYKTTNIILTGGVDDVLINKKNGKLVVVDYKSQVKKKEELNTKSYLEDVYHQGYKTQLEFYSFLFKEMGFEVDQFGYFIVCNGSDETNEFNGIMKFDELIIPYELDDSWIPKKIDEMIKIINSKKIPSSNESCMNCAYARQRNDI